MEHELAELLRALLAKFSEHKRELLSARFVEGLTYREIAERFHMPEGTVATTMLRLKDAVLAELKRNPKLMKELRERNR